MFGYKGRGDPPDIADSGSAAFKVAALEAFDQVGKIPASIAAAKANDSILPNVICFINKSPPLKILLVNNFLKRFSRRQI